MKVVVFGSTGGTGSRIVEAALAAGYEVTAFARRPEAITAKHARLRVAQGDVTDGANVAAAVAGQDAVLVAIGAKFGTPSGTLTSTGVKNVIAAMQKHGVRRLVFESGLMVGETGLGWVKRTMISVFRAMNRDRYQDGMRARAAILESALDWTIVRPPTLAHTSPRGKYRVGENLDVDLTSSVSHADVADYMTHAAGGAIDVRKTVDLSY